MLRHLPPNCDEVLEIGCGRGDFSRRLATVAQRVTALDLAPEMITCARAQSAAYPNIEYQLADVMTCDFGARRFDCIASLATLHHLPFVEILERAKRSLRPGGVILVMDLVQPQGLKDAVLDFIALPVSASLRIMRTRRLLPARDVRAAWKEHEKHDSYLTITEVRNFCDEVLPRALVRKHLLWRYSLVWQNR
jgi:ubiquinone/menaquinone biosynthesis C-methylase UbiE